MKTLRLIKVKTLRDKTTSNDFRKICDAPDASQMVGTRRRAWRGDINMMGEDPPAKITKVPVNLLKDLQSAGIRVGHRSHYLGSS